MFTLWEKLGKEGGVRFAFVSALNFGVGYLIFSLLWVTFHSVLNYFLISFFSTLLASVWSYQTQNRFTLKRSTLKSLVSWQYLILQVLGLVLGALVVPAITQTTNLNLLIVQLAWSFVFSLIGLLVLFVYSR
jgi:hypothetical protein